MQLTRIKMQIPKSCNIIFEAGGYTFLLKVPYNPYFNETLKSIVAVDVELAGCEWVAEAKSWRLWTEDFDKVVALINKYYGRQ